MITNKTILIVGDSVIHSSGVGNQLRHVSRKLIQNGNKVITIGVINDKNIPQPNIHKFDGGEEVMIYYSNKYDDIMLYDHIIKTHAIDCIVLMTDPYRFYNYFTYSYLFRSKLSVYYISVWDSDLVPVEGGKYHFNLPLYESFDAIGCISKQTFHFTNNVLSKSFQKNLPVVSYVGHGSDENVFKPLMPNEYTNVKDRLFRGMNPSFVVMLNSRNQSRKKIPDLIEAFKLFSDSLSYDEKGKVALLLQTELSSEYGTNLVEVCAALAPHCNIFINTDRVPEYILNQMYNCADVVVNISNAEGFGLSANEGMLAGKPLILNNTGGLKDQGNGPWCKYVTNQRTIIGSPMTPYLTDLNANIDDVARKIREWYDTPPYQRKELGLQGRQYCIINGLTANQFSTAVVEGISKMVESFVPINNFNLYKI